MMVWLLHDYEAPGQKAPVGLPIRSPGCNSLVLFPLKDLCLFYWHWYGGSSNCSRWQVSHHLASSTMSSGVQKCRKMWILPPGGAPSHLLFLLVELLQWEQSPTMSFSAARDGRSTCTHQGNIAETSVEQNIFLKRGRGTGPQRHK